MKEVNLPAKGGFGPPRAFGDRCQPAQVACQPLDDEAGIGQRPGAQDDAGRALNVHLTTGGGPGTGALLSGGNKEMVCPA